jgi:2-oxoisovalerate dehydrogenase E1 component
MSRTTAYRSDRYPNFTSFDESCGSIRGFAYEGGLHYELGADQLTAAKAIELLSDMVTVRAVEEMIIRLASGAFEPLSGYQYRGPTHVSVGQEATSVGACDVLGIDDYITSTHRGHGDAIAKGFSAIRTMPQDSLRARLPSSAAVARADLVEEALEEHLYRIIAELFGKEEGYCRGRGGGMHICDFSTGHLGANAIVGAGVPIATGAAMALRLRHSSHVVCCFAGDGAYAQGVVLESLNWATQAQWTNDLASEFAGGLPIIYFIQNNHYGMTHRTDDEVMGIQHLARRGAGFAENNMNAEVVNGMDVLAVRDAVKRAANVCRSGGGPVLVEASTYRFYGHNLSDPRTEYRTKEEESRWRAVDAIARLKGQLVEEGIVDEARLAAIERQANDRVVRAAVRASQATDPSPEDVCRYTYTDTVSADVPAAYSEVSTHAEVPVAMRDEGTMTYRDALREGLVEEMLRDARVIYYGEDVAEYGGAFKSTRGLLEAFGRERIFNTPISEACICGTGVGAAMVGMRPVVELMYMDFALMASDQIANQAAKWHSMSGGQIEVPLVIRASIGAGKGYGGQHSQSLESVFSHIPGLYIVYPATPSDAKGLLKTAIRDNNPVLFLESQRLYGTKGVVPEGEHLVPFGAADVTREGGDVTIVAWGPAALDALVAADQLRDEDGIEAEVIDLRSLVPLDMETVLASVRKTGRCVVGSQAILVGSYVNEIVARIQAEAFGALDAPVGRFGAPYCVSPHAERLEHAFLPGPEDIRKAVRELL